MILWTLYFSFLGAVLVLLLPGRAAKWAALSVAVATLAAAFAGASEYMSVSAQAPWVTLAKSPWIPSLGISWHLAADGISITLVLLTALASVAGVLFSWNVAHRPKEFFALYLTLIGGVYGVFFSVDLFLFMVFYEIAIIPKYFLIAVWGSTRREYGAMKLALYSFIGSALSLAGILAAYAVAGGHTFDLLELASYPFPPQFQYWAFPLVFVGFAILAGMWPFHTWAPTGHVAAPTAASMLLAGVVMKLGAYGCLRVAMPLFPIGLEEWSLFFAGLGVVGIIYGALVALAQTDFKFVIGYSSVSHMGFVILGLMTLNAVGLQGAVMQMFSHGVIAGLLFAVVGRMVYDRTHTRELSELGPMQLYRSMPFVTVVFVLAGLASMGLPGFSGFVAELMIVVGAWRGIPWMAVMAGLGILLAAAYTLRVMQLAFFGYGDNSSENSHSDMSKIDAISWPEKTGAVLLLAASLCVGLRPSLLLDLIAPAMNTPLVQVILKGAGS